MTQVWTRKPKEIFRISLFIMIVDKKPVYEITLSLYMYTRLHIIITHAVCMHAWASYEILYNLTTRGKQNVTQQHFTVFNFETDLPNNAKDKISQYKVPTG